MQRGVLIAIGTMALYGGGPVSEKLCAAGAVGVAMAGLSSYPEEANRLLLWLSYFQPALVAACMPGKAMRKLKRSPGCQEVLDVLKHGKVPLLQLVPCSVAIVIVSTDLSLCVLRGFRLLLFINVLQPFPSAVLALKMLPCDALRTKS